MKFEDLEKLYLEKKKQFGAETYKHISELLKEAKEIHKRDWLKHPTPDGDHEQSWRAFKGKNLEKLVQYIITDEVEEIGLKVVNGNQLERSTNLSKGSCLYGTHPNPAFLWENLSVLYNGLYKEKRAGLLLSALRYYEMEVSK